MGYRVQAETLQKEDAETRRRRGERWSLFAGAFYGACSSRFANNALWACSSYILWPTVIPGNEPLANSEDGIVRVLQSLATASEKHEDWKPNIITQ